MLSSKDKKYIRSLRLKKYRIKNKAFIAEGPKIVRELLKSSLEPVVIYGITQWTENNSDPGDSIHIITKKELEQISNLTTPNKVIGVFKIPDQELSAEELSADYTLYLDRIKDPGNAGTIIRTADWFGIQNIIFSVDSVDAYNPKVVQGTMGSISRVNIQYKDLQEISKTLESRKIPVYGTAMEGENLFEVSLDKPAIIIIGSEHQGISPELIPMVKANLKIPGYGGAESLNASVASGIICAFLRLGEKDSGGWR